MQISQLVVSYMAQLPIGCVLTEEQITRSLREAVRQFCGYARLKNARDANGNYVYIDASETALGAQDFDLTVGETSVIRPLWYMYLERENALALEASRSQGAEVFGRGTAEVGPAIELYEQRLPGLAFSCDVVSI
jgi:hypothetical protein